MDAVQLAADALVLMGIVAAVWRLEDRFVRRADFLTLRREVRAVRVHLGIPEPNGDDEP